MAKCALCMSPISSKSLDYDLSEERRTVSQYLPSFLPKRRDEISRKQMTETLHYILIWLHIGESVTWREWYRGGKREESPGETIIRIILSQDVNVCPQDPELWVTEEHHDEDEKSLISRTVRLSRHDSSCVDIISSFLSFLTKKVDVIYADMEFGNISEVVLLSVLLLMSCYPVEFRVCPHLPFFTVSQSV